MAYYVPTRASHDIACITSVIDSIPGDVMSQDEKDALRKACRVKDLREIDRVLEGACPDGTDDVPVRAFAALQTMRAYHGRACRYLVDEARVALTEIFLIAPDETRLLVAVNAVIANLETPARADVPAAIAKIDGIDAKLAMDPPGLLVRTEDGGTDRDIIRHVLETARLSLMPMIGPAMEGEDLRNG